MSDGTKTGRADHAADTAAGPPDVRGHMHRIKRLMDDGEARQFLAAQKVAHVATVDGSGRPYVVPLIFIYEGADTLYVHTGAHDGHFQQNVQAHPDVCVEVADMGPVHPGRPYACNSALVYTSVITFGRMRTIDDTARKTWFFDRILEKYGDAEWSFEPGYPYLDRIVLYEQQIEILTGKHSAGLRH